MTIAGDALIQGASLFLDNQANDGEFLVDLVFTRNDFARNNFAVEFLHEKFELAAFKAEPNVTVRGAEGFFFVLRQVKECKSPPALEDSHRFLKGQARIRCMVKHLAHQDEIRKIVGKSRVHHIGHLGRHVQDIFLLQDFLEAAHHLRVVVECRHMLATVAKHQREVAAFAAAHIDRIFERIHEATEQAYLRLEASTRLVQLMDLSLGLVGAVFEHLGGATLENILIRKSLVGIANHREHPGTQVKFLAQAVIRLDAIATILEKVARRKLRQMSARITLVNIQNVLDFVDGKFRLVQKQQDFETHFVGNGSKQVHAGYDRFAIT